MGINKVKILLIKRFSGKKNKVKRVFNLNKIKD